MERKEHIELEINKSISDMEKLVKKMALDNHADSDTNDVLMACFYSSKQEMLALQKELIANAKLDVQHLIDDRYADCFIKFVKILGVETSHINRHVKSG